MEGTGYYTNLNFEAGGYRKSECYEAFVRA